MLIISSSGGPRKFLFSCLKFLGGFILLMMVVSFVRNLTMTDAERAERARKGTEAQMNARKAAASTGRPSLAAAVGAMRAGRWADGLAAYQALEVADPKLRGTCEGQIGAAYYMLGDYDKALVAYQNAIDAGEDPGMMKDNIAEARAAKAKGKAR